VGHRSIDRGTKQGAVTGELEERRGHSCFKGNQFIAVGGAAAGCSRAVSSLIQPQLNLLLSEGRLCADTPIPPGRRGHGWSKQRRPGQSWEELRTPNRGQPARRLEHRNSSKARGRLAATRPEEAQQARSGSPVSACQPRCCSHRLRPFEHSSCRPR